MTDTTIDDAAEPGTEPSLRAEGIIKDHVIAAMAIGLVPVPVFDIVAVVGVQMRMVHSLARHYDVPFRRDLARATILSLIGGVAPVALGATATSLLKFVPGLGSVGGGVGVVLLAGAMTYAVGRIFAEHLASGGSLLTLRSADVADRFAALVEAGKAYASDLRDMVSSREAADPAPENAAEAPGATSAETDDAAPAETTPRKPSA